MQWFLFLIYLVSFRWWLTNLQLPSKTMSDRFYSLKFYAPHHLILLVMSLSLAPVLSLLNNSLFIFALPEMHSGCGLSWTWVGLYKDPIFWLTKNSVNILNWLFRWYSASLKEKTSLLFVQFLYSILDRFRHSFVGVSVFYSFWAKEIRVFW